MSRILHDEVWWRDLSSRAIGTAIGTGTGAAGALLLAFVSGIVASPFGPLAFAAVVVLAVLVGAAVRVTRRPRG